MSFFSKMKTLIKSDKPSEDSNVNLEVSHIKDAKIGDFVAFGFNDLIELSNHEFQAVSEVIIERRYAENTQFLKLSSPSLGDILIDHKSDNQHIYVYKELFFNDLSSLTKEDEENVQSILDCSEDYQAGIKFDDNLDENTLSKFWIQNQEQYFGISREELFKHVKTTEDYIVDEKEGEHTLFYTFQSSDREYRLLMTVSIGGETMFYCGRRIEPKNIKSIFNPK